MNHHNYGLFLAGLLTEEEMYQANDMAPGGETPLAQPPLGNTFGGEGDQEDHELDELTSQMQRVMGRLLPLIAKMKNKQKGFVVLHTIGQAVQNALKMTDTQVKNATLGNMPQLQPEMPTQP